VAAYRQGGQVDRQGRLSFDVRRFVKQTNCPLSARPCAHHDSCALPANAATWSLGTAKIST